MNVSKKHRAALTKCKYNMDSFRSFVISSELLHELFDIVTIATEDAYCRHDMKHDVSGDGRFIYRRVDGYCFRFRGSWRHVRRTTSNDKHFSVVEVFQTGRSADRRPVAASYQSDGTASRVPDELPVAAVGRESFSAWWFCHYVRRSRGFRQMFN